MYPAAKRVALDWLLDRINLKPQIHVKYVDTRSQLADILIKGTITRDEWNHLLQLFNIMNASLCSRSHSSVRIDECAAMSKRTQEKRPIAWLQDRVRCEIWSPLRLQGRSRCLVQFLFH